MIKIKIRKGDKVYIRAGKDRGKIGKVLSIDRNLHRLTVEGVNLLIKHLRPKKQGEKGQRVQFPAFLPISKVILVCPKCSKNTRVSWKLLADRKRVRLCNKCNETMD